MSERTIHRLTADDTRPAFDCIDKDLNEFFAIDSIQSEKELLSVTYVVKEDDKVIAFFSLSNDAIKKQAIGSTIYERVVNLLPAQKRYSTMPAVKIGRLATDVSCQSKGVGSEILDYLKYSFINKNKTGCRFLLVDAYNNERTIKFYQKNGFSFLSSKDEKQNTRLMVFDLITVK